MHIDRFDPQAESGHLDACYRIFTASVLTDDPGAPPMGRQDFAGWWSGAYSGDPHQAFLAADGTGSVGCCLLELPERENTNTVSCMPLVAPEHRRRGVGTALLAQSARQARAADRTVVTSWTVKESAGTAFAAARGAVAGIGGVRRVLDLADCPAGRRAVLRAGAEPMAAGYSLVAWCGPTPEEYIDRTAAVSDAMDDAPRNPGTDPERWDADRIRTAEQAGLDRSVAFFGVAAIHDGTGEMAALTQVAIDNAGSPDWADQLITAVTRPHRGHRLGLLVKLALLDLLAEQAPRLRRIATGNAELNQHMIAINEQLGFRVTGRFLTWELDLASVSAGR